MTTLKDEDTTEKDQQIEQLTQRVRELETLAKEYEHRRLKLVQKQELSEEVLLRSSIMKEMNEQVQELIS